MSNPIDKIYINKHEFERDVDDIRKKIQNPTWKDFKHLKKIEAWGRIATFLGYIY